MNKLLWTCCAGLLIFIVTGCSSVYRQDITSDDNIRIVQPPANSHVQLTANAYLDQSRSTLWISGNARNTTGIPLTAGHVHAILRGPEHELLAERQFVLSQNGGTPRLRRGSNKTFGGEIAAKLPSDFKLEVVYHMWPD